MTVHFLAPENKDEWNPIWKKCFDTWISKNSNSINTDNSISIWTDEGIDKLLQEDDEEFYNEYLNKCPNIYKWDYVRYIILERYGGMYVDMDVELIDNSFINKLHPRKIYLMEGTGGTYVENSIMISPLNPANKQIWNRVKVFAKNKIIGRSREYANDWEGAVWVVGAQLISEFFIKHLPYNSQNHREHYDILAWEHFGNKNGTLNYTKHYQTSTNIIQTTS